MTYQNEAKQKVREGISQKIMPLQAIEQSYKCISCGEMNLGGDECDCEVSMAYNRAIHDTSEKILPKLDTLISQTITDLLDVLEKEMGKEAEPDPNLPPEFYKDQQEMNEGYNTLHKKLTKKFNQIRM